MWLSQFIQWCFIGIPAAFTIYLANKMTELMLQGELLGEISSMGKIMGYIVPVAFLAVGFFVSLQTGAMGASAITTRAKKGVTAMGKATVGVGVGGAGQAAQAVSTAAARIRQTYQAGRTLGLSRPQAAGESIKRYWQRRVPRDSGARWRAVGKIATAPARGTLSAVRDIAMAGAKATLGIKKKGFRKCPTCKATDISKTATACPHCGHTFE